MDRETRGGDALGGDPLGIGYDGHGHGLMQLDDRAPDDAASDLERALYQLRARAIAARDVPANVQAGAVQLARLLAAAPTLAHAVAAYNGGDRVFALVDPDRGTTGKNYSADVLGRARMFDSRSEES
jgi:hypothetical protein